MATYTFVKPSIDPTVIYNDIPGVLDIPMPDDISHEMISFHGQTIANYNAIVFTFSDALSGGDESALNTYMASYDGIVTDDDKIYLADSYLSSGFQVVAGLLAKMEVDGKTDSQKLAWFNQVEAIISALSAGFLSVALDRLTSVTSVLTNFLTGTMTSGEVTELRQLLQKLLGKTLT